MEEFFWTSSSRVCPGFCAAPQAHQSQYRLKRDRFPFQPSQRFAQERRGVLKIHDLSRHEFCVDVYERDFFHEIFRKQAISNGAADKSRTVDRDFVVGCKGHRDHKNYRIAIIQWFSLSPFGLLCQNVGNSDREMR